MNICESIAVDNVNCSSKYLPHGKGEFLTRVCAEKLKLERFFERGGGLDLKSSRLSQRRQWGRKIKENIKPARDDLEVTPPAAKELCAQTLQILDAA